ncbi:MAG: protein BatD, partial [Gammaproteobacteria bacterium]|nr:protein BatD [Gammaproteobacteria bacterium]
MTRTIRLLVAALLLFGAAGSHAEELKASVERNPIHAGESVRLVLELRRAAGGLKPDLGPLDRDFQILHTSANTQIEFVQGLQSAITRWTIELTPKREGALTIPSISVGQFQSLELALEVLPPRQSNEAGNRDIFLEAEVSPDPAYVQAQMRYVVRLLRSVDVVDGTLTEPSATNAVLRRLGRDISYTTNRDGRSYRVLERRYAMFPQISGELVVSPVEFEGEVVDPSQASSGLSRLFARGKRVRLRTPIVRATAIAPPADYPGKTWLPAKNLQISEEWSKDPDTLLAGEPLTRTLRLQAVGLSAEQLPEIAVTVAEGVKEYGDQPITRTTTDTDWVHGVREQRTALVPGNEGNYTLAEIRIDWWD